MKNRQASSTAEAAAAIRALESLLPAGERLFEDRFAREFLKPWHRALLGACKVSRRARDGVERLLDRRYPGVPADFICRTRYIDDAILAAASKLELERLVILGAGYDTRALRLPLSASTEIIEVDHPLTQRLKRPKAEQLLKQRRAVAWVPHDFTAPPRASPELARRFGLPKRTFWVLEGVAGYLPQASVEKLLSWISDASAAGSRIALTYVQSEIVDEAILADLDRRGEPFVSSWTPERMREACRSARIELTEDISESECARRYLEPLGRGLRSVRGFRIATGEVSAGGGAADGPH